MGNIFKTKNVYLAFAAVALAAVTATPAWAGMFATLPGPAAGILAGAAIIGALVIAKWWRRK